MTHLIKKNLKIHKSQWFIYFGMTLFFLLFNKDSIFIISLISAIIIMNEFYYDEKANGDKLWNSLPFTRKEIVGARYVSLLFATFLCTSFVFLYEWWSSEVWVASFWKEVLGSLMLMLVSAALCFPILYGISKRSIIFGLLVLYILLVIGGSHLFYYSYMYIYENFILTGQITDYWFFGFSLTVSVIIYFSSWILSVKLYTKRDIV